MLLVSRTSPLKNSCSAAEILMGKRLRTTLPVSADSLAPCLPEKYKLRTYQADSRKKQQRYFDIWHGVRDLAELDPDTDVWILGLAKFGTVQGLTEEPGSYWVNTDYGSVLRNRTHLVAMP